MLKANRVLILEDEPLVAVALEWELGHMGHTVVATLSSVSEALQFTSSCQPDLIIADAQLSDGSGIAVVNEIIKAGFVPHVFVSGDNCRGHVKSRGSMAVEKPYVRAVLADAIQRVLSTDPECAIFPVRRVEQSPQDLNAS